MPRSAGAPCALFRGAIACAALLAIVGSMTTIAAAPPPEKRAAPVFVPRAGIIAPAAGDFDATLRARLEGEARRQRLDTLVPRAPVAWDDEWEAESGTGRRVGRVVLRALRGALDERLEEAARGSAAFAPLFRWIDTRGGGGPERCATGTTATGATATGGLGAGLAASGVPAASPGPGEISFRFRLDAHPRLLVGTRFGSLTGRIEIPLLEREVRMSLDRPLGGHGRASFRGGVSAERGEWADLALQFRF